MLQVGILPRDDLIAHACRFAFIAGRKGMLMGEYPGREIIEVHGTVHRIHGSELHGTGNQGAGADFMEDLGRFHSTRETVHVERRLGVEVPDALLDLRSHPLISIPGALRALRLLDDLAVKQTLGSRAYRAQRLMRRFREVELQGQRRRKGC